MTVKFFVNGRKVSKQAAMRAWVRYDTNNNGSDPQESAAVFARSEQMDMNGAEARDYMMDAGVEVQFSGTGSSYDAEV